jgi:hypothetical protein
MEADAIGRASDRAATRPFKGCFFVAALVILAHVALVLAAGWIPPYYSADPIEVTIVDEEGRPVEGALVVALWCAGALETTCASVVHRDEALSDGNGRAEISGFWRLRKPYLELGYEDPVIYVYKPGYYLAQRNNQPLYHLPMRYVHPDGKRTIIGPIPQEVKYVQRRPLEWSKKAHRLSYWNGREIELRRTRGPEDDRKTIDAVAGVVRRSAPGWVRGRMRSVDEPHPLPQLFKIHRDERSRRAVPNK